MIPIDISNYDTSSYAIINTRLIQYGNSQMISIVPFLKPVELNPLEDKINFINTFYKILDNWDGYGAKAPNQNAINNAISFIKLLPSGYQKLLNVDEVNITPYGTIVLEWYSENNNFVSIEIGNSKIGFFSETPDGENPLEQSIEFISNEIPNKILPVFSKVFSIC